MYNNIFILTYRSISKPSCSWLNDYIHWSASINVDQPSRQNTTHTGVQFDDRIKESSSNQLVCSHLSFSSSLSLTHTHTTHIYTVFDLFSRCLSLIIYFILSHLLAFTLSHSHSLSFSLVHILSLVFLSLSFIVSYHFISLLRASLLLIPFLFLTKPLTYSASNCTDARRNWR